MYPETIVELLEVIGNKSNPSEIRSDAKNRLAQILVTRFKAKILGATGGRIGINDSKTEIVNSAFIFLNKRASHIADAVRVKQLPLAYVVSTRIQNWAIDKIRKSDGNSLKRGKGVKFQAVDELQINVSNENALDELVQDEVESEIRLAVDTAISRLGELEQSVVLSYFGLDGNKELTLRQVADALNLPYPVVRNAWRSARKKLQNQLENVAVDQTQ